MIALIIVLLIFCFSIAAAFKRQFALATYLVLAAMFLQGFLPALSPAFK